MELSALKDISHFSDHWMILPRSFWMIFQSGVVRAFPPSMMSSAKLDREEEDGE